MRPWSKVPAWWSDEIAFLRGGAHAGRSQAMLRVVFALATMTPTAKTYTVVSSVSELMERTGLSRPMVRQALVDVEARGWIRHKPGGGKLKSEYTLACPHFEAEKDGYYYKIPNNEVVKNLPKISRRGEKALAALKIYAVLLIVRPNQARISSINVENLRNRAAVQWTSLRDGLSILATHGMIVVDKAPGDEGEYVKNQYVIKGDIVREIPA